MVLVKENVPKFIYLRQRDMYQTSCLGQAKIEPSQVMAKICIRFSLVVKYM